MMLISKDFDNDIQKAAAFLERNSLTESLINQEHDASQFIEDYIQEMERIDEFFIREIAKIEQELTTLKQKHQAKNKIDEENLSLNQSLNQYQKFQELGQEKDELDYAISWKRAFTQIYVKIKWLNSFGQTNQIASET